MKVQWTYKDQYNQPCLAVKTNHHIEVELFFENGHVVEVMLDGFEYQITEELLSGLFVAIGDEMVSIIELSHKAQNDFDKVMAEVNADDKENEAMRRELSSPYATGRI